MAPIFFVLMFAIVEAGAVYIGESWLAFATRDVARELRTGQVQAQQITQQQFRDKVCQKLAPMFACDTKLMIDVRAYNDFASASYSAPLDSNGNLVSGFNNYQPGTACQVVLVRTFYQWQVQTPFFTPFLVNMSQGRRLLSAADAFRNEPFTSGVQGCGT